MQVVRVAIIRVEFHDRIRSSFTKLSQSKAPALLAGFNFTKSSIKMQYFSYLDFYASAMKHLGIGISVGRSVGWSVGINTNFKKGPKMIYAQ